VDATYDVVVVGSGFGGGIAACRLAEAGKRVCVLERGRRFGPGDFPDRPEQAPFALWHPKLNPNGLFDLRLMRDLSVLTAAGVGGGSLIYANVQLNAPPEVFTEGWPEAIDLAELAPYYARTEEALDPQLTPEDPPVPKVTAFRELGRLAGVSAERLPIAVHFGEDRTHPFSGVHQQVARTSAGATSDVRAGRRTRSTSRTSLGQKTTARRSIRCTRCSRSTRRGAAAAAGSLAFATSSTA
jgi:cholesterol oxidase